MYGRDLARLVQLFVVALLILLNPQRLLFFVVGKSIDGCFSSHWRTGSLKKEEVALWAAIEYAVDDFEIVDKVLSSVLAAARKLDEVATECRSVGATKGFGPVRRTVQFQEVRGIASMIVMVTKGHNSREFYARLFLRLFKG